MVVSPRVTVTEKRNIELEKRIKSLIGQNVMIGYWSGENKSTPKKGDKKPPADMVIVARTHEYGIPGKIPQRSFLRSTVDENHAIIMSFIARRIIKIVDGKLTLRDAMNDVGKYGVALVKKKLEKSPEWAVPLSPKTVAARKDGTNHPLIDSGQLWKSVDYRIDWNEMSQGLKNK